jgi:hypothetical protein
MEYVFEYEDGGQKVVYQTALKDFEVLGPGVVRLQWRINNHRFHIQGFERWYLREAALN